MKPADIAILMEGIAPVLRELVAKACAPALERLADLEKRFAELPAPPVVDADAIVARAIAEGPKAPTKEEVKALFDLAAAGLPAPSNGKDGIDGKDGAPGADGRDGKDVDPVAVKAMVDEAVSAAFATAPVPKDGRDGVDGADGAAGRDGVDGKDGRDGTDGKDADPKLIAELVDMAVSQIPTPKDGRDGEKGEPGETGKDGIGLAGALIDRDGGLVVTMTDGKTVQLGAVVGKDGAPGNDGRDGLGFDDLDVVDDGMAFVLRFARGEQVKEFRLAKPTLADMHRGVWKEGPYPRGSVVTWGGSLWMAKADTEAKPETNEDWLLVTKRGRDGRDGELKAPREPATVKLK